MSATSRVLAVMARLGTFTVEDLAARSGVSSATVHTVLRRNSAFIREIGVERTGKPGGQPRRYQVDPEREVELLDALAELRADLIPAGDAADGPAQFPAELAGDPLWLPLSVSAAESLLFDEFPEAPADQRSDLLQAANEYVEHARRALDTADAADPTRPQLAAHLELLDFARSVASAETGGLGHANCQALLNRMPSLQWDRVGAETQARVLKWMLKLVHDSAAREAARMPVDVLHPRRRGIPALLNEALERLQVMMPESRIRVTGVSVPASVFARAFVPRLRVLAFDHASIRSGESARIIPAVADKMGPMDELVVASEEMDTTLYGQALSHGATFMYLGSSELSCDVLQQRMERAGERFVAETSLSAFGAALNSPASATHGTGTAHAHGTATAPAQWHGSGRPAGRPASGPVPSDGASHRRPVPGNVAARADSASSAGRRPAF